MNLAELKRTLKERREFVITNHRRPEFIGQVRVPNIVNTVGFYTKLKNSPTNLISRANNGKGSWLDFGKVGEWDSIETDRGTKYIKYTSSDKSDIVMEFFFL